MSMFSYYKQAYVSVSVAKQSLGKCFVWVMWKHASTLINPVVTDCFITFYANTIYLYGKLFTVYRPRPSGFIVIIDSGGAFTENT